jgi:hypothetical protein
MSYSKTEKYLAQVLAKFPQLKSAVKRFYSIVNFHLYKKSYNYKTESKYTSFLSDLDTESFFGYYDKSPANSSGKYIIFHESNGICTNLPTDPEKPIKIVLYNIAENCYHIIADTNSFNWQQGCRLQWLNENKFIFNDFDGVKFISKIYDLNNKTFQNIDYPIYDCFLDEFALSLNFTRLIKLDTHYGYKNIQDIDLTKIKNDGIYFIDLKSGKSRLVVTLEKVIELHPKESMKDAQHCFNHIMISPDGKDFIFIHRWYQAGKRYDSLILSNIEGTELKVLSDEGFVSHCCWFDPETVIGYLKDNSCGNTFYKINIKTGKIETLSNKLKSFGDGHPSFYGKKCSLTLIPIDQECSIYIFSILKKMKSKRSDASYLR